MSTYTISPCLLKKSDEPNVVKIILAFLTDDKLKVALDDKNIALDEYSEILKSKYTSALACWLENIANLRKYEIIEIGEINENKNVYLEICSNTFGTKHKMLVGSKQNFKGYTMISNHEIKYGDDSICIYDPEEALSLINNSMYIAIVR